MEPAQRVRTHNAPSTQTDICHRPRLRVDYRGAGRWTDASESCGVPLPFRAAHRQWDADVVIPDHWRVAEQQRLQNGEHDLLRHVDRLSDVPHRRALRVRYGGYRLPSPEPRGVFRLSATRRLFRR